LGGKGVGVIDPQQIQRLFQERKHERAKMMGTWQEIIDLANGDIHVHVAELDESRKATVVNLFPAGLSQFAQRAGSVQPDQSWPPLRDGFDNSENRAHDRRSAGLAWWTMNNINIMDRQRFLYGFGFGEFPVSLSPVSLSRADKRQIPHWRIRNPFMSFPAPRDDILDIEPCDAIFACQRSRRWLTDNYPAQLRAVTSQNDREIRPDDMFDVLEYSDYEEIVIVLCSRASASTDNLWTPNGNVGTSVCTVLERVPNKANCPLAVFPGRLTLDRIQGALDQMVPAYRQAARLNALNELAIVRGVFPHTYLQGYPSDPQHPEVITEAKPMMGIMGEVAHGQVITVAPAVGAAQMADMAIDRSERSQRIASGLPSEVNGESGSNIRTARRGEMVLGAAIDMPLQEMQELMAHSKEAELRIAVAVQCGYFGSKKTSFYVPRNGRLPKVLDYTPEDAFETDEVYVKYAFPGMDASQVPIALGQRINEGLMSIETAMETDPLIEDPTLERLRIQQESLTRALLASLDQGVQQGVVGPDMMAQIVQASFESKEQLYQVVQRVHQQVQAQQAAQQQGGPQPPPGLGPPAGPGSQGPPPNQGLGQVLQALRAPANQSKTETAPPQAPPLATSAA
jgi:hypothetical protein